MLENIGLHSRVALITNDRHYQDHLLSDGLTKNSQSRILIADYWINRIDIINQDGQSIRCIGNLYIRNPCALCVERRISIVVVESGGNNEFLHTRFICVCITVIQWFQLNN